MLVNYLGVRWIVIATDINALVLFNLAEAYSYKQETKKLRGKFNYLIACRVFSAIMALARRSSIVAVNVAILPL